MTLQATPSLLASTVLTGQGQVNESALANTTAGLATGNASTATLFGINQSAITVNSPGSVVGTAVAGLTGTAISVGGNADADAGSVTGSTLIGIEGNGSTGFLSIGGTGSVQGSLLANLTAAGTSTDGNGDASAGIFDAIGIRSGDTSINGDGTVAGLAMVNQSATARSTAGASNADAQVENLFGLTTGATAPSLQIAGTGALYGAASLVSTATASTTGDDAAVDTANATQRVGFGIGLDLNGSTPTSATATSIGGAAAITGQVEVVGTANASGTTANSSAVTNGEILAGIRLSEVSPLQGNAAAIVTAAASGVLTARSTTTSGGSTATVDTNVYGVLGGEGAIAIGANGVLNASALLNATAIASTIDGLGNNATASVTPVSGQITGLFLNNTSGGLSINGNGTIIGTAETNQLASASTVSGGNASATVVEGGAPITGIDGGPNRTSITVAGNTQGLTAGSVVNVNADAKSVSGAAAATSKVFEVNGLLSSNVEIKGNGLGDVSATSNITESLSASSTSGNASSETTPTILTGSKGSDLTIGGSGSVKLASNLTLTQLAQSTSGASALVNDPNAAPQQDVMGIFNGNVSIGSNGSIDATATTRLNQRALNVTGNANAYTDSVAKGIQLKEPIAETINIKGSGSISSIASSNGVVEASTSTGNSIANALGVEGVKVHGALLEQDDSLSIQGSGNINIAGSIGSSATPFLVKATSVNGNADASELSVSLVDSAGLVGDSASGITSNQKSKASTSAGVITSSASSYLQLSAATTDGSASAGTNGGQDNFSSFGVKDANIIIDSATNSEALGSSIVNLGATSKSVSGNSVSRLQVESAGLFGTHAPASARSSVQSAKTTGISEISATSAASTILGNSVASTLRNSLTTVDSTTLLGIDNYNINSIGAGTLNATSIANMKSIASSVSGSSTASSTL